MMLSLTRNRAHACLVGLVVAVVLPMRTALKEHYAQQRQTLQRESFNQRSQELARSWSLYNYTNATGSVLAETVLTRVDWSSLQLIEIQQKKLKSRLHEVFEFLGNPGFEEYYRLKTEGLTGRLQLSPMATNFLVQVVGATNGSGNEQSMPTLKTLWVAVNAENHTAVPTKITAISLDHIKAATSRTNSYNSILKGKVGNGLSVMGEVMEPGFHYGGQTNAVSSDSAQGLFVHLSFFARFSASSNAGPVYLSLYWSEPDENWALSRLFADRLLNLHTLF